jgi:hypothetical protein
LLELGEAFAASRKEHLGEQPEDTTREERLQQARNMDLPGASGLGPRQGGAQAETAE